MRKVLIILLIYAMINLAFGASIGTAPGLIEIDNLEPGDQIEEDIFVTTNLNSNFTLAPSAGSLLSSSAIDDDRAVSEQGSGDWISIEESFVDPTVSEVIQLEDGSTINAEGNFTIEIDIPSEAEPGVHKGIIELNSDLNPESDSPGAITIGQTRLRYYLGIEGNAQRDIVVRDVRGFRTDEDRASIEVLLSNEGTVTTSVESFEIDVFDSSGSDVDELDVNGATLEPGEHEWVNANWVGDVSEGTFQLDGEVNYVTGSAYASGSFSLGDILTVEEAPDDSPVREEESDSLPLWLVLMILVVLGVLMWSFEIDPVWIFGIVGVLAISGFILMSDVSNLLLVGVLIPALLIIYLGV